MRGFLIDVATQDDTEGIRFKLYDNDIMVLDNIGAMHFKYLTPDPYLGLHTLTLTYYREDLPEVESDPIQFYQANFTLPILTLEVTVELLG